MTESVLCRTICRARLVPFVHPLEYNLQSTASINDVFELAPAAGPSVIEIGHKISNMAPTDLKDIQAHIHELLPGLDSRTVIEYTLLMASALKVNILNVIWYTSILP